MDSKRCPWLYFGLFPVNPRFASHIKAFEDKLPQRFYPPWCLGMCVSTLKQMNDFARTQLDVRCRAVESCDFEFCKQWNKKWHLRDTDVILLSSPTSKMSSSLSDHFSVKIKQIQSVYSIYSLGWKIYRRIMPQYPCRDSGCKRWRLAAEVLPLNSSGSLALLFLSLASYVLSVCIVRSPNGLRAVSSSGVETDCCRFYGHSFLVLISLSKRFWSLSAYGQGEAALCKGKRRGQVCLCCFSAGGRRRAWVRKGGRWQRCRRRRWRGRKLSGSWLKGKIKRKWWKICCNCCACSCGKVR